MEFTCKISEKEYLQAWKLRKKGDPLDVIFKVILELILFWFAIFISLILLWLIVHHGTPSPHVIHQPSAKHVGTGLFFVALAKIIGPFFLIFGIWIFMLFGFGPMRARRAYRKDPRMKGPFTVNVNPSLISVHDADGTSSQEGGDIYEYWREGNGLIVLVLHSGAYSIVSLASLTEPQRAELRGILTSVLPKK
jgi:hypothetical protein